MPKIWEENEKNALFNLPKNPLFGRFRVTSRSITKNYKILQYEIPILKIVPKQNEPSKKYFFLNPDAKKTQLPNSKPSIYMFFV